MWVTEKFDFKRNSVFERNIVFRYRHIIWINQFPSWAAQVNDAVARCTRILPLLDVVIVLVNVRTICFVLIELWARAQVCLEFLVCFFLFWRTYQNIRIFTNTMELVYTPIQIIIIRKISDYIEVMIVLYFFSSSKLHSIGEFFLALFRIFFCSSSFEWERFNNSFFWVSQFSLSLLLQLIDKKKKCLKNTWLLLSNDKSKPSNQVTLSHSRLFRWLLWICYIRMCRCTTQQNRSPSKTPSKINAEIFDSFTEWKGINLFALVAHKIANMYKQCTLVYLYVKLYVCLLCDKGRA